MTQGSNQTVLSVVQHAGAFVLAAGMTLVIFLFLPVMQSIRNPIPRDLTVIPTDITALEPPPPAPIEEEIEEEEKPPEPLPELTEEAPPLDLSQLELALNPGLGEGMFGDFSIKLVDQISEGGSEEMDRVFSLAELDQRPRVIFQRTPTYPPELRRSKRRGTVHVVFTVDTRGRVSNPKVDKSTDPAFDQAAIEAVKQWKFEPGTRNGEKVQFKLRVPITFNAG
jgi:periplasmic protein TonB